MNDFGVESLRMAKSRSCVSFVLPDNALFSGTGYKVLKNQDPVNFIPCVKSEYNGHVKLTYFTGGRVPIGDFAQTANAQACRLALEGLVKTVYDMGDNGFLSQRNIVLAADAAFIDRDGRDIGLIYLPVSISISGQSDLQVCKRLYELCVAIMSSTSGGSIFDGLLESRGFETGDYKFLYECIQGIRPIPAASGLRGTIGAGGRRDFSSGQPMAESNNVGGIGSAPPDDGCRTQRPNRGRACAVYNLLPVGERGTLTFHITKSRTVIGKHEGQADCVITTSRAVSRTHCLLTIHPDGMLGALDLDSTNGTYVNGRRLLKGEEAKLIDGSILRLADVEFSVQRVG